MSWWNPFAWFGGPPAEVPGAAPAPVSGVLRVLVAGFNQVDPKFWGGWDGALGGCKGDAEAIARACRGARSCATLTDMTVGPIEWRRAISNLAELSAPGDRVVIWYSGHGGTDLGGDANEPKSEYLCLPRGPYPEWDLQADLLAFRPGVQVLYGSDSCHSYGQVRASASMSLFSNGLPKSIPLAAMEWVSAHYHEHFKAARAARELVRSAVRAPDRPDVLALLACREDEYAYDGRPNGAFTGSVLEAWRQLPGTAARNLFEVGPAKLTKQHPQFDFVTPGGARVWNARAFA